MTHTGRRSDFVSIIAQAISLGVSWVARRLIFGLWSFAEPFNVGFRLLPCLVGVLAYLGNGLVIAHWFYVDDYTFAVGCANNPPIRESGSATATQKAAVNKNLGDVSPVA
jgi:hypothetical protein